MIDLPGRSPSRGRVALALALFALTTAATAVGAATSQAATLALDSVVTTNQTANSTTITSPAFSTRASNELLVAFVTSEGPMASGSMSFSGLTTTGLTWQLRRRANGQFGTSEIWQAVASSPLTNATVKATRLTGSYPGTITVASFLNADTSGLGATAAGSAPTGAATVSLTTTRAGGWVWGAGNDWDRSVARTMGPGQTKVNELLLSGGATLWTQRFTDPTPAAGTAVALGTTAPTTDQWNLAAMEILPAPVTGPDTQPPTAPRNLKADSATSTRVSLSWSASTDDVGVAGYQVFRDGTRIGDVPGTSFVDTTVAPQTSYSYTVRAYDAAGHNSDESSALAVTTPATSDTTPPTVAVTAPASGATLSGSTTVAADASDNAGVSGVQFLLDGANLGSEDTTPPYSVPWNTASASDGPHTLRARARDAAGNATTSATVNVTVTNAPDPSQVGSWGPLIPLPAVAIHNALTPTGSVLMFAGSFTKGGEQYLVDPLTGGVTQVNDATPNLFCAAQAVLADGRVDVAGGTSLSGGLGVADNTAYDWKKVSWTNLAPMQYPRWYATATTLSDGKVLVTSGANKTQTDIVPVPELYSPDANTWRSLTAASRSIPYYSFVYQLPNGKIIRVGASEVPTPTETLDLATNQWQTVDSRLLDGGSAANYAPGKFLKAGTASDGGFSGQSANTAYTLDMNAATPSWQPTASMAFPRSFLNLTNLPDGTVLATGGGTDKSAQIDANAVLPAEDWDPVTGRWTTYAPMSKPRLYHSGALLLPDGRVYVSGSGGDDGVTDQKTGQIFSPPYLFKGARPTIASAPDTVHYDSSAFVRTPDAESISRVSLIRTGSVTHAFDENARALSLSFTQTVGGIDVKMPANGNLAPPGYYMLFIVNGNGVPSTASFVRFPAPYEDTNAPTQPTNLTATGHVGSADLSWSAASDDFAVTRYNVHRSTSAGFSPTAANKIGESTSTSFHDSSVAAGNQYYVVTAEDAAGNVGPASNEATAVVSADGGPPTVPTGLGATGGDQSVSLTWNASTDDVGVTGYRIYRDGSPVGTTANTSYKDTGLAVATTYSYTVSALDGSGGESARSDPVTATTSAAAPLTLDRVVTTHQSAAAASISSPALSTARAGELIVAFLASDGPNQVGGQSFSAVTGGGLTWKLRQRTNTQPGTAEIWQAVAPTALSSVVVKATRASGSWQGTISVAAFTGADTTTLGAVAGGNAPSGAPDVSLTTTRASSWVWGVGTDWSQPIARALGTNQTLVDQYFSPSGDTYWVQRRNSLAGAAGSSVQINDTAPTADRWNLSAVEILSAPPSN